MSGRTVDQVVYFNGIALEYREDCVREFIRWIRLSPKDAKFMSNLLQRYVKENLPVTLKQSAIFERIVTRYRKQLDKLGLPHNKMLKLPWRIKPLAEAEVKDKAHLTLTATADPDHQLTMFFPFNKEMIDEVRAIIHDDAAIHHGLPFAVYHRADLDAKEGFVGVPKCHFRWSIQDAEWHGRVDPYILKNLITFAKKHSIPMNDEMLALERKLNDAYGSRIEWQTKAIIRDGKVIVNCITEEMLPLLSLYAREDATLRLIEDLYTGLGIEYPDEFMQFKKFMTPRVTFFESESNEFVAYLDELQEEVLYVCTKEQCYEAISNSKWVTVVYDNGPELKELGFINSYRMIITNQRSFDRYYDIDQRSVVVMADKAPSEQNTND